MVFSGSRGMWLCDMELGDMGLGCTGLGGYETCPDDIEGFGDTFRDQLSW